MQPASTVVESSMALIKNDTANLLNDLIQRQTGVISEAAEVLARSRRIFFFGAGRSGLALKMTAMRLMHLGHECHVVGSPTTPAILPGDVLVVASGSGTTGSVVRSAEGARGAGASVISLTTNGKSPLAELSDISIPIPAATKQERPNGYERQYAGSLFEQSIQLVGDAIFHTLWQQSGKTADEIWPRHANLE
ncbi:6-phospho-3-hexuloisomerase [Curtobacterium sp. S6]|uniref:6-phospho-3-hexuloisomerase n=1 Tax=Curtobacterium sp. S6 TaxID=1479623 RepID=UPI0004AA9FB4|nr:6-phospho-3-hexuloisomerase [Curtobacterium sp. S6]